MGLTAEQKVGTCEGLLQEALTSYTEAAHVAEQRLIDRQEAVNYDPQDAESHRLNAEAEAITTKMVKTRLALRVVREMTEV